MRVGHTLGLGPQRGRFSAVTILVGMVMLLVPALAWMQYQWLGQISTAERDRMQRTLRTAAAQFANEFDSELSRTLISLQVDGAVMRDQNWSAYAQNYSKWASSAAEPRLVRDIWLVDTAAGTPLPNPLALDRATTITPEQLRIRKWNDQDMTFEPTEWPADMASLRNTVASRFIGLQVQRSRGDVPGARRTESTSFISSDDDDTLIAPVTLFEMPDGVGAPKISILGLTVVRLDSSVVRETVLASLASRHFHGNDNEADYRVAVVERDNPAKVIWESEPGAASLVTSSPDATQPFMAARPEQMIVFARNMRGQPPPPPPAPAPPSAKVEVHDNVVVQIERANRNGGGGGRGRVITRSGTLPDGFDGRWTLMAKHRAGSLEAAVAAARTRNLLVSFGVLLLLSVSIGLILVSARRAQELARQQMEFVAAVSHELRTPVSVIGAAAGNLADGVVGDPQRVRKYGETIQGEARRLGETVERVLQLAGIAAGRAAAARTTIGAADLVNASLSGCRSEIDQAGVTVEVSVADDLPPVAGDAGALRSAVQNLISNAVKYGGTAKWLRVSARRDADQVLFTVEDRGLGISADDRSHIFEPFYRGRDAVSQQIQGSGLGLNLVMRIAEAHGGRVTVSSEPGKGSAFTLAVPAAPAETGTRTHAESESLNLAG